MGKVKIKKKSTLIDMTAMSDVTVLLLTFFMLTSTFLKKEPTVVHTPSSVSEEMIPGKNLVQVLISSADLADNVKDDATAIEGKIFLSFQGDSTLTSEDLRQQILEAAVGKYNSQHPSSKVELTPKMISNFRSANMLGMPFRAMNEVMNMEMSEIDKIQSNLADPRVGIPIDSKHHDKNGQLNDFQVWMAAINTVAQKSLNDASQGGATVEEIRDREIFFNAVTKGEGISIKADRDTPYDVIHQVLDNMQTMNLNKFSLQTALKTE